MSPFTPLVMIVALALGSVGLFSYSQSSVGQWLLQSSAGGSSGAAGVRQTVVHQVGFSHAIIDLYLRTLAASVSGYALQTSSVLGGAGEKGLGVEPFSEAKRAVGDDWPEYGYTMIGMHRLASLRAQLERVMGVSGSNAPVVPGDMLECGVWRGGASIFATGVLVAWNDTTRQVHLCDSFHGLPVATTAADSNIWQAMHYLEVSMDTVKSHFARFYLLDESRVKFYRGYFQFSLPHVRRQFLDNERRLAVLRLDGDMWESTMDELFNLYELLNVGGVVLIDDWKHVPECKAAIETFMQMHHFNETVVVDNDVAYWIKEVQVTVDYQWYVDWNKTRAIISNVQV